MQSSLYRYYFVSAVIFYKNMESNMNKDTYMYIHYTICIKIYNFFMSSIFFLCPLPVIVLFSIWMRLIPGCQQAGPVCLGPARLPANKQTTGLKQTIFASPSWRGHALKFIIKSCSSMALLYINYYYWRSLIYASLCPSISMSIRSFVSIIITPWSNFKTKHTCYFFTFGIFQKNSIR